MKVLRRIIDVELTNRCNALCSFCPRSETPEQGFMSFDTFKQVVARVKELDTVTRISFTGQGESTLHPELVEFVRYGCSQGLEVHLTTNANLLDKEKSHLLLEAGLGAVSFSVSDFGEDYELVYNLDFEKTRTNILDFMDVRDELTRPGVGALKNGVGVVVSIVIHDLNKDKIEDMKAYWTKAGIKYVMEFEQSNRGGACDNAHYFIGNDRFEEEALTMLAESKASVLCSTPFFSVFVGWNGQYYICCSDYKKETPLGSVFDYSIDAMDRIKLDALGGYMPACAVCNIDPVNAVREKLFEIEAGDATSADLDEVLEYHSTINNKRLPKDIDILQIQEVCESS